MDKSLIWHVLQKKNGDATATSAHLTVLTDLTNSASLLRQAFPAASDATISAALSRYDGMLSQAYSFLSTVYVSDWDPSFTPAHLLTTAGLAPDLQAPLESLGDFIDLDPRFAAAESQWWSDLIASKEHRIASLCSCTDQWAPICALAASGGVISPRFVSLISDLGSHSPSQYSAMLASLHVLPSYLAFSACQVSSGDNTAALDVLPILLAEGLINPGMAVWLAINTESSPLFAHLGPIMLPSLPDTVPFKLTTPSSSTPFP
jgi:hypothetical protein